MFRKLLLISSLLLTSTVFVFGQSGTLKGKMTDKEKKDPIPFATIVISAGGKQIGGANSDFDGNYTIKPIPPGKYDVKVTSVGFKPMMFTGVVINSDKISFLDVPMESSSTDLKTIEVVEYKVPLISKDGTMSGGTATSEEIAKMPGRSATSVAVTVGGVFSKDGEVGSIRGQRSEGTVTYIDGVRVRGSSSVPQSAIEQVSVITGGTPAQYGDATGGVINITTKGPSRIFGAGIELLSSQIFDAYDYNLIGFNLQGPLIMGRDSNKTSSLLGFFLSGELSYEKDPSPYRIGVYKCNDETLAKLEKEPIRPTGLATGGVYKNSEFVTKDMLTHLNAKQNVAAKGINLSGKIDVRTSTNTNLTFGGSMDWNNYNAFIYSYSLFNTKNNPEVTNNTWRVFGRFTQRYPTDKDSKSIVKNIYYSIQADYSKYHSTTQDPDHKDNLFNYGYLGKYTSHKAKYYEFGTDTNFHLSGFLQKNNYDTLVTFERSEINPELANYTSQFFEMYPETQYHNNLSNIQLNGNGNGLLNGDVPESVYGLWANTGTVYNSYAKTDAAQMGININASADIKNHAIQFGLMYEQRSDRYVGYSPVGLWTLARQLTNKHIEQLDFNNGHPVYDANNIYQDTINYDRIYDATSQSYFDYSLRQKLGKPVDGLEWIDVDSYDPTTFSINMFSPDELLNSGNSYIGTYGYDYYGNKLTKKPSFDDFFTQKDANGNYTRAIGAFEPIYIAGYISDKFYFNDLIFNVGVRVDRFDANQKVLKDPFLLFQAKTLGEVSDINGTPVNHPTNMGSDYVVYVNDVNNPSSVVGYRNGDTWYNAEGTEIADPTVLETPSGIAPYLVDPADKIVSSKAFVDYKPQTSVMPRISFSFPISDEALFFAHYDILTQRPTSGGRLDPTNYYFIQTQNNQINNPNLKAEKTTDYELGFQQKLSNASSLKFSAYYKEMKNQIQAFRFIDAYPRTYTSWNNIDFGTVKGMTISYDLRRTGNVWMKASYTLQFADGTGSDATSGLNMINSGQPNLRTTNPFSYDQRHAFVGVLDYRFADGKAYNGPKWTKKIKGSDKVKTIALLQNTGVNFTFNAGSGTPFSRQTNIVAEALGGGNTTLAGTINGSRLPWQFKVDARIDRDIYFNWGKREMYVNVYLQVLNVLNSKNIMGVYQATGNPDDDGYLAAAEFQNQISAQTNEQAFRDQYAVAVNRPWNYSLPRRVRLGVSISL